MTDYEQDFNRVMSACSVKGVDSIALHYDMQDQLRKMYGFAIPNDAAVEAVAAMSPIVEIGAGTGYWAHILTEAGADVIAYDIDPHNNQDYCNGASWFPVITGSEFAAGMHPDRTLMLCWPPYDDASAFLTLNEHARMGGRDVVFIGEGWGGCTGDDQFHETLEEEYKLVQTVDIPQWHGIHDYVSIHRRKIDVMKSVKEVKTGW